MCRQLCRDDLFSMNRELSNLRAMLAELRNREVSCSRVLGLPNIVRWDLSLAGDFMIQGCSRHSRCLWFLLCAFLLRGGESWCRINIYSTWVSEDLIPSGQSAKGPFKQTTSSANLVGRQ